ncbi:hypothetical protein PHJA_002292200 [Phtheirospermum japonicum]|uniref:Uncharacterized protein n=1 Tax=Phtheirospermum japonicum TaxID=374723 RepID=A0A830CTG0_9LAMI|nr:hypothetical protein PHJA_002292200 [Phtheirospermum japonicum]
MEVEPRSVVIGLAIMMLGVVFPVSYMIFRNKRVPSYSSFSKQTYVCLSHIIFYLSIFSCFPLSVVIRNRVL